MIDFERDDYVQKIIIIIEFIGNNLNLQQLIDSNVRNDRIEEFEQILDQEMQLKRNSKYYKTHKSD